MATSSFKSTTKRSSIDCGDGSSSSKSSHRRSRSLSQFSNRLPQATDYPAAPKGNFVNTVRGSDAWPEISLDDLALEFFSGSSITNDEDEKIESGDRGRTRSSRRGTGSSEIGRWASETASSKRRGRSTSRHVEANEEMNNVISNGTGVKSKDSVGSSIRRRRSVSVSRQASGSSTNVISNGIGGKALNSDANSRRRRSMSVARYHISDSESDADHFRGANSMEKKKDKLNGHILSSQTTKATGERLLQKSAPQKDVSRLYDGYSSHSSVLTDDETKGARCRENGNEKTIHAVYAQQRDEHPKEDTMNNGWRDAMRKEVRHAVKEIRSELEHAVVRNNADFLSDDLLQSDEANALHSFSGTRKNYATEFEQMMLEEQHGKELTDLPPYSNNSAAAHKHIVARRKCRDKNRRMSNQLSEEAEKFLEDFLSSVEDTDMSSFDGDKSDVCSTLGRATKPRDSTSLINDDFQNPAGSNRDSAGMDGVILPWLKWETTNDASLLGKTEGRMHVTPKTLQWDAEQDITMSQDHSGYSASSQGSWCPGISNNAQLAVSSNEDLTVKECMVGSGTCQQKATFDMSEYVVVAGKEEVLFELFNQRNRIDSGGLLLCCSHIF